MALLILWVLAGFVPDTLAASGIPADAWDNEIRATAQPNNRQAAALCRSLGKDQIAYEICKDLALLYMGENEGARFNIETPRMIRGDFIEYALAQVRGTVDRLGLEFKEPQAILHNERRSPYFGSANLYTAVFNNWKAGGGSIKSVSKIAARFIRRPLEKLSCGEMLSRGESRLLRQSR